MQKLPKQITIRLTDRQHAAIEQTAALLGVTRNTLCRVAIADRIASVERATATGKYNISLERNYY